jgi:hypothetical protein
MHTKPRYKDIFEFFRLALVTGLLDKSIVVAWADREIINSPVADHEVIELSLSKQLPYSKFIGLMNTFEGIANPSLSTNMLLALADQKCESDMRRTPSIIQGIRLLQAEPYLHQDIRIQLANLDKDLMKYKSAEATLEELHQHLSDFLATYREYARIIQPLGCDGAG